MNHDEHRERFARLKNILLAVADLPAAARSARLDELCGDDTDLRREVETLLDADDSSDEALEALARPGDVADAVRAIELDDVQEIAGYRIVARLGAGGMGVVFEAEQENPQRRVALKVVRSGVFVDDLELKMFQREADSLARLQHPGIADIYEAGQTPDGHHFFAMELIRGRELDEAFVAAGPSTHAELRRRLDVFVEICDAVNYAHQRGVIHRDLKPSNILVDEEGRAKVLDFGIARIVDADGGTVLTQSGSIQGTLAYMSPEQTRGLPGQIDLRTDVYSLGVVLYELIAGRRPYDVTGTVVQAIRVINEEPPRSLRENDAVMRFAGGDLETIVQTALAKDPEERYESAAALRNDVERAMADQPILARPPSTMYQVKKLVKRNRIPVALAGLLLVTLIGFGIGMSVLFARAEAERQGAEVARGESEAVTTFMVDLLSAADPDEEGRDVTVREVLDEGAQSIDGSFDAQPLVKGRLLHTMGDVYAALGYFDEALPLVERAVSIREDALGPDSAELAESLVEQGSVLSEMGDFEGALPLVERSLRIQEEVHGPTAAALLPVLRELGNVHSGLGDFEAARPHVERALSIGQAVGDEGAASSASSLAILEHRLGNYDRSIPLFEQALELRRERLGPGHNLTSSARGNLATALAAVGRTEESIRMLEEDIAIKEENLGPEHPGLARALVNLADKLRRVDPARALPHIERAIAIQETALGPEHPDLASALLARGGILTRLGETERAFEDLSRGMAIQESALGPDHASVAHSLDRLASLHESTEDYARARPLYERSLAIRETAFGPDSVHSATSLFNLVNCLIRLEDHATALPLSERLVKANEEHYGLDHEYTLEVLGMHATILRGVGRTEDAAEYDALVETRRGSGDDG